VARFGRLADHGAGSPTSRLWLSLGLSAYLGNWADRGAHGDRDRDQVSSIFEWAFGDCRTATSDSFGEGGEESRSGVVSRNECRWSADSGAGSLLDGLGCGVFAGRKRGC
jgi:hypothetical protein